MVDIFLKAHSASAKPSLLYLCYGFKCLGIHGSHPSEQLCCVHESYFKVFPPRFKKVLSRASAGRVSYSYAYIAFAQLSSFIDLYSCHRVHVWF